MSATIDFYLTQAEKCTAEAETSPLNQVRDRNLRAAAAWQAMADKLLHSERLRAEKEQLAAAAAKG
ncbi:hypothetical protein CVO77_04930 [Sphingopyxis lindanitolerans]|uniref:Uncharacterized protein n=1 Tax=Sphingopyxis lindanitolerans TaxID=2054227 RepID=A0A2S8B652_9SPHN|nr:hypothetical protein [Sphingopyxis lindanitolerans]PQM27892.1 hypothetical protein CVO77_04930 [Sphingopyxis lindanitolerans]